MLVAESTRRSNICRLRSWLGESDGVRYLPEAYSGFARLNPLVSSDWEDFLLLIAAGVDQASEEVLAEALSLVRGAPLADVLSGSWGWAESWRNDMYIAIRDVAVMLAIRSSGRRDFDQARWALDKVKDFLPFDEQLLICRIRVEQSAGNRIEVDRLILGITRSARSQGLDLSPAMSSLIRQVIESNLAHKKLQAA
jgi:hypothetical protein